MSDTRCKAHQTILGDYGCAVCFELDIQELRAELAAVKRAHKELQDMLIWAGENNLLYYYSERWSIDTEAEMAGAFKEQE